MSLFNFMLRIEKVLLTFWVLGIFRKKSNFREEYIIFFNIWETLLRGPGIGESILLDLFSQNIDVDCGGLDSCVWNVQETCLDYVYLKVDNIWCQGYVPDINKGNTHPSWKSMVLTGSLTNRLTLVQSKSFIWYLLRYYAT